MRILNTKFTGGSEKMTLEEKHIELYKASLPAFFTNELEADKTILGLSVAAIGFYMAMFLNKDFQITEIMFITIVLALVSFLIASAMILMIFVNNKKLIIHIIKTTGNANEEPPLLAVFDKWKYISFASGMIFSIIFTLSLMYEKAASKTENSESKKDINRTEFEKQEHIYITIMNSENNQNTANISHIPYESNKKHIQITKKNDTIHCDTSLKDKCECIIKFDKKGNDNESK